MLFVPGPLLLHGGWRGAGVVRRACAAHAWLLAVGSAASGMVKSALASLVKRCGLPGPPALAQASWGCDWRMVRRCTPSSTSRIGCPPDQPATSRALDWGQGSRRGSRPPTLEAQALMPTVLSREVLAPRTSAHQNQEPQQLPRRRRRSCHRGLHRSTGTCQAPLRRSSRGMRGSAGPAPSWSHGKPASARTRSWVTARGPVTAGGTSPAWSADWPRCTSRPPPPTARCVGGPGAAVQRSGRGPGLRPLLHARAGARPATGGPAPQHPAGRDQAAGAGRGVQSQADGQAGSPACPGGRHRPGPLQLPRLPRQVGVGACVCGWGKREKGGVLFVAGCTMQCRFPGTPAAERCSRGSRFLYRTSLAPLHLYLAAMQA